MGTILALYIMVWPVITAAVLYVIVSAFLKDFREARRMAGEVV